MAERTTTTLMCDVCGTEPADRYVLAREIDGRMRGKKVDLCTEHAKPVVSAIAQADAPEQTVRVSSPLAATNPRSRPGTRPKIYTQEELDAMEAKARKKKA